MTEQGDMFPAKKPYWQCGKFDGSDVTEADNKRLTKQLKRVFDLMKDCQWRTLAEISAATGDPEASISAQLRHLKKQKFGSYQVDKQRRTKGQWEYRVWV